MKNKKMLENQIKTTTVFGYGLFIVNAIVVALGLITFGAVFFEPYTNQLNVAILLIFIAAHLILPTLVSYIIGDKAAHAKNKKLHHYNGVLFGIAAYWLSMLVGNISSVIQIPNIENTPFVLARIFSAWPILATIAIMTIVAVVYNRKPRNNKTMLQYLPYQLALFGAVVGTFVFTIINLYPSTLNFDYLPSYIMTILTFLVLVAISYKAIPKNNNSAPAHTAQSIVAVSIGLISVALVGQFAYPLIAGIAEITSYACGLIVWIIYLRLMSRKS